MMKLENGLHFLWKKSIEEIQESAGGNILKPGLLGEVESTAIYRRADAQWLISIAPGQLLDPTSRPEGWAAGFASGRSRLLARSISNDYNLSR
jgi:hypothetical protein